MTTPAKDLGYTVLKVLSDAPRYGYQITQQIRTLNPVLLDRGEGHLYPALYRLEDAGLIRGEWIKREERNRRVYSITRKGHKRFLKMTGEG